MNLASRIKENIKEFVFSVLGSIATRLQKDSPLTEDNKSRIKKILVAEGGGMGDVLRIFPAMEALHANFPGASLSLFISPSSRDIISLFPERECITELVDYDQKGRHKSFFKKIPLILYLRKQHFDLSYFPCRGEGMRELSLMHFLISATNRLGFRKGQDGYFNTVTVEFNTGDVPIVQQNLAILKTANLAIENDNITVKISGEDRQFAQDFLKINKLNAFFPLITIHAGAAWNAPYRCWPAEKYISLITTLVKEFHAVILLVGSKNETRIGADIVDSVKEGSVTSLIGKTTISQMAAVIQQSHIFIGNDSGPLHIASAFNVPFVGIFTSTLPGQVLLYTSKGIVLSSRLSCSPCYRHEPIFHPACSETPGAPPCMDAISVSEVAEAVRKLLG